MIEVKLPAPPSSREIAEYEPKRHRLTVAGFNFGIEQAKRIKDWPVLEEAVDLKIAEQRKFVAWWQATVSVGESRRANRVPGSLSLAQAENLTGMTQQRLSDLRAWLEQPDEYRDHLLGSGYRAAMLEAAEYLRGTQGTGENEWFTPDKSPWPIITMAVAVLGEIDLDPASSDEAQRIVRATRYFTKADDGLKQEWHGRVWLNPPYAQPFIAEFASKMVTEVRAGRVTAAIMLTHNYTDTSWFHEAAKACDAICFTRGRVKFYQANGKIAQPSQGQAFFYFGAHVRTFAKEFESIGFVR